MLSMEEWRDVSLKAMAGTALKGLCCCDLDFTHPQQQAVGAGLGGSGQHHSSRAVEVSGRIIAHDSLTSPCAPWGHV